MILRSRHSFTYLVFVLSFVIDTRQLAPDTGFFSCPHLCIPKFLTMCIAGRTAVPENKMYNQYKPIHKIG